ncbi:MAG: hypothetical protein EXR21_09450 [Flavobacteriaceae bacterium]|nr:hypothetical protein [Flavobacteriaceae bacterium]
MRKIAILCLVLFLIEKSGEAQAFKQNDLLIEGFLGGPNIYGQMILKDKYSIDSTTSNFTMKSSGPRGLKAELMWGSRTGISFFYSYANTIATWQSDSVNPKNVYQVQAPRNNLMLTINYHFWQKKTRNDLYTISGLGYRFSRHKETTNDTYWMNRPAPTALPVVNCRLGLGYRHIFTGGRWVFHSEMCIGGPFLVFGIGYKTKASHEHKPLNQTED